MIKELRTVVSEVTQDKRVLRRYASDYSLYRIMPSIVVVPVNTKEVVGVVRWCRKYRVPLTVRAGGSSLQGQCLGTGVILDCKKLNRLRKVGKSFCVVQPGMNAAILNKKLGARMIAPDPSSLDLCAVGGMVATNASGRRAAVVGDTLASVMELEVVLASGEVVRTRKRDNPLGIVGDAFRLAKKNGGKLKQLSAVPFNNVGYRLEHVAEGNTNALFVGAEGTLGVITEVTMRTIPRVRTSLLFVYSKKLDFPFAKFRPLAVEFFSPEAHKFLRRSNRDEFLLVLEFAGRVPESAVRAAKEVGPYEVMDNQESIRLFWRKRNTTTYALRLPGKVSFPFIEDTCVPVGVFPKYYDEVTALLRREKLSFVAFGHLAKGLIHVKPYIRSSDVVKVRRVSERVYRLCVKYGGSMSGEHGDGRSRVHFVRRRYPDLFPLFKQVKRLLDPLNILNPGLKVSTENQLSKQLSFVNRRV